MKQNMKRFFLIVPALVIAFSSMAQTSKDEYLNRYALLVGKLGQTGVGIETLINKWEAEYPDDVDMLCAKFNYYYTKAQKAEIVRKDQPKFLGNAPVLTLDDSTGVKVNYFEEVMFDDEMYGIATKSLDDAIRLAPDEINLRFSKITSLIAYEKESPDMATQSIRSLIDYNCTSHPKWKYGEEAFSDSDFVSSVMEYCYAFYKIGTPASLESFKSISEKMSSYYPKTVDFISNVGSYYLIAKDDSKTALKYYNKALKLDPKNYSTIKNCVLLARRAKNVKLEKKYLQQLLAVSEDEIEKASCQARLDTMK